MFRHKGDNRTLQHNLRLASLLSFVAGIVNVAGYLSVKRLTTNVTGHFAFFVDEVFKLNLMQGLIYFLYIFFFFLGSFVSGLIVELYYKRNWNYAYTWPVIIESIILLGVATGGNLFIKAAPDVMSCLLLFSMGVQNSLVTKISNSLVRTTHLTGLFTDLGIECSQLFFYSEVSQKKNLYSSIRLRLTIITFFFLGGISGGLIYSTIGIRVLLFAGLLLLIGIVLDYLKLRIIKLRRRHLGGI